MQNAATGKMLNLRKLFQQPAHWERLTRGKRPESRINTRDAVSRTVQQAKKTRTVLTLELSRAAKRRRLGRIVRCHAGCLSFVVAVARQMFR